MDVNKTEEDKRDVQHMGAVGVQPPRSGKGFGTRSVVSRARSVRSTTSSRISNRRSAIQVEAAESLHEIETEVDKKEAELDLLKVELDSVRVMIEARKSKDYHLTRRELETELRDLYAKEFHIQTQIKKLEIELKLEKRLAERKKQLVKLHLKNDLDELQSEEEVLSREGSECDSTDGHDKQEKSVSKWVDDQIRLSEESVTDADPVVTKTAKWSQLNRVTADVSKATVLKRNTQLEDDVELQTVSYSNSSDDEIPVPKPQRTKKKKNDNISMKDIIDAVYDMGARAQPPPPKQRVVMRGHTDGDLPKFGGEPEKWVQFVEEYHRTTKKFMYDDSENLIRLRKALVGQAKQTVEHLMANVRNVPVIIDSLQKRFGRPRIVLNALAAKAKACGPVSTAKPESIIEFGLAMQALTTNVTSFGETGYFQSVELLDSLVKKLSHDMATRWYEWIADDKPEDLQTFSKWINIQLNVAYQRVEVKTDEKAEARGEKGKRRGPGSINAAAGGAGGGDVKCLCCDKPSHTLEKCYAFKKMNNDEKWKVARTKNICVSCLKVGHRAKDCRNAVPCKKEGCSYNHHHLFHVDKAEGNEGGSNEQVDLPPASVSMSSGNYSILQGNVAVIKGCDGPLPILPTKCKGPIGEIKCHVLLDTGASRSLMTKSFAKRLGLTGRRVRYSYGGVTGQPVTDDHASIVECQIAGLLRNSKYLPLRGTVTVDEIKMSPYSMDMEQIKENWPYMKNVAATTLHHVVPDIIIGNNNPQLILARKIIGECENGPVGWRSNLGWAVAGIVENNTFGSYSVVLGGVEDTKEDLHQLVQRSFSFEEFGVKVLQNAGRNLDEKRAYEILENTTRLVNGVWETGLLWRKDDPTFPPSECAAMKRLLYTENKMKNPEFGKLYRETLEGYLAKGYMRKLSKEEQLATTPKTYVIPHFGHLNPNKPGKLRFILDAKATVDGVSLNSQLLKGPDLIQSLVGILWKFRRHQIALTGDISDMFHRIRIREEDRESQRLLWRDGDKTRPADHYEMMVMIFGATSSPASAMYVKNKNAERFLDKYPKAADVIINHFYVDDCLSGGDTVSEVIELRRDITEIHEAGNFKICKWTSNSRDVINSIPEDIRAEGVKDFGDKDIPGERILGMWWDPTLDVFQFKLGLHKVKKQILAGDVPTKRQMCGLIMSLYDPLGFIIHYRIKGLMLLQEVWRDSVGWDDEIQMSTYLKWKDWLSRLEEIRKVNIPRCYSRLLPAADDIQLHTFSDASFEALSAVCYFRVKTGEEIHVSFVSAKARVAPLKKTTIPRMELQAALLGSRLANSVTEELGIKLESRHFWVDSTTILFWFQSRAGKLKEFVANRVGEIQETTKPEEWHWIPTKMNIADIATRFESEISFSPDCEWYKGPPFLYQSSSEWTFKSPADVEEQCGQIEVVQVLKTKIVSESLRAAVPAPGRLSSYIRLVRATAAVQTVTKYWLNKIRNPGVPMNTPWKGKGKNARVSQIGLEDIRDAEIRLFRIAQEESFGIGDDLLQKRGNNKLWKLSPVRDETDGLIRVDGRIKAAKGISFNTHSPIILPPNHEVTQLLIQFEHEQNAHQGVETVFANIRKKFWLIDGRNAVRRVFGRCQLCRVHHAKPAHPIMGSLPAERLEPGNPPFTSTGVDLFGPMEVTVGRRHEKRWGVIFCCMVTRGIHLEVVHSPSTDEFMMALSRFIDTRGRPKTMMSDNGTNFVGSDRVMDELWSNIDKERIVAHAKFLQIEWIFNPPAAPHMGGAWERLIQSVKKCLKVILKEKFPHDTTLLTAMKSIENIMNSRPLVHQSDDVNDPQAITPNHLLRGTCDMGPAIPYGKELSDDAIRKCWKRSQVLADQFWSQWTRFYLPKLLLREKWHQPSEPLQEGSLVRMIDDNLARNFWLLGFVSKTFPGKDGHVRVIDVTVKDANGKVTVYRRPTVRVCPIGLRMEIGKAVASQFRGQDVVGRDEKAGGEF